MTRCGVVAGKAVVEAGKEGLKGVPGVLGVAGSPSPSGPMSAMDDTSSWRKSKRFSAMMHCFLWGQQGLVSVSKKQQSCEGVHTLP